MFFLLALVCATCMEVETFSLKDKEDPKNYSHKYTT